MADLTQQWPTSHNNGRPHATMADLTQQWPTSHSLTHLSPLLARHGRARHTVPSRSGSDP
eukprot:1061676-Prorocentrum_minimum.AAC.1